MTKRELIYLLSPSYSGSTLLTMLIAQHPDIATIGELKATSMGDIDAYQCSCGELIKECNFWKTLEKEMHQRGFEFSLNNFGTHFSSSNSFYNKIIDAQLRGPWFERLRKLSIGVVPGLKTEYNRILKANEAFIDISCQQQGARYFVDGSKDPQRLQYFIDSGLWHVKVICITRDGRAQSLSHREKSSQGVGYRDAVLEWKLTMRQIERVSRMLPKEDLHSLKYEDLCDDPVTQIESIWKFLELDGIDCDWENVDLKQTEHHILGNRMRLKSSINISLDTAWLDKLDDSELNEFEQLAGAVNRRLGYQGS